MFLQNYFKYGRNINSLEFSGIIDDYNLKLVSATISGDEIKKRKEQSFETVDGVIKNIENNHCILTINGPQVIVKEASKKANPLDALRDTFPNLDLDIIYYQIWEFKSKFLIAIARKSFVENVINLFSENKINVIGISLSFFSVKNVMEWINHDTILLGSFKVDRTNGNVTKIEKPTHISYPKTLNIQDETIESPYVITFAGLSNYFTNKSYDISNLFLRNKELYKGFMEKVFFKRFLSISLGLLCAILLINYFLFSSYYSEHQELEARKNIIKEKNITYELLKNSKIEKLRLIENIKSNTNSRITYHLNQLVVEKPDEVNFSEMIFQPLMGSITENEAIKLKKNQLHLKGKTFDDNVFTKWIINLENMEWIESLTVSDFVNNQDNSDFSIVLITVDETK